MSATITPVLALAFLHPLLLAAGVACVAIPILIHLLMRRRRRPQRWAAMRFLLEAYRKQRRRLRLEQWLLLVARCLIVLLVALALGRPFLGAAGLLGGGATTLYVVIDDSLTGSAQGAGDETALARHIRAAEALLGDLDPGAGDRAAVITLSGPPEARVMPPSSDLGAVGQVVARLTPTDSRADLASALDLVRADLGASDAGSGRVVVAVLSDFLSGAAPTGARLARPGANDQDNDPLARVELLASRPAPAGAGNVSLMDLRPLRTVVVTAPGAGAGADSAPAQIGQARVTLRRTGAGLDEAASVGVTLAVERDGERAPIGRTTARFEPGQTEVGVAVTPDEDAELPLVGDAVLVATIDRDGIEGDNVRRRAVALRESIRIGLVAPARLGGGPGVASFTPADWLRLALEPSGDAARSALEIASIDPSGVDAARLAGLDAAVIASPERLAPGAWTRLGAFAREGGLVVVMPAAEDGAQVWTESFTRAMGLDWAIDREPTDLDPPAPLDAQPPEGSAASDDPLALIRGELDALAPAVRVSRLLGVDGRAGAQVVLTAGGRPLLLVGPPGEGRDDEDDAGANDGRGLVALFAAPPDLDWTDLPAKPLMVPLMQELVRQGVGRARGGSMTIAGGVLPAPRGAVELRRDDGETRRVRDGRAEGAVRSAGVWRALDDRGRVREIVAVNPDAAAGDTTPVGEDEVGAWLASAGFGPARWLEGAAEDDAGDATGPTLGAASGDTGLSWPLLLAAGLLALVEMALARFASHASAGREVVATGGETGAAAA